LTEHNGHRSIEGRHCPRGIADLDNLLEACASLHHHLCPRQVLGVRMGLLAGRWLGLPTPQTDKRMLVIMETYGCAADGVSVASGCWVGRRTMRILDFGKVAATFVDTLTARAVRIAPRADSRQQALYYAPDARERWQAYLIGYQRVPDSELFKTEEVVLNVSLASLLSREGYRVRCQVCGEEVFNQREVCLHGLTLCRACAGESYYEPSRPVITVSEV